MIDKALNAAAKAGKLAGAAAVPVVAALVKAGQNEAIQLGKEAIKAAAAKAKK